MNDISDYWMRMARRANEDLAEAERRISSLTLQLKGLSRVEDFIRFGRALALVKVPYNYKSRREAISIIWYELEKHLGIELSPIYGCTQCSQAEFTTDAGSEEAAVVESGECPYCEGLLERI